MKLYNKVIPYILMGSAAVLTHNSADAQIGLQGINLPKIEVKFDDAHIFKQASVILQEYSLKNVTKRLVARARNTRDTYMANMLAAEKRLAPQVGKNSYRNAVRKELPGAPAGAHCMYGQYTQLMRALNEQGDTLTIIPDGGKSACTQFKVHMRKKYQAPEYAGVIREGHAYESKAEYDAALNQFLIKREIIASPADAQHAAAVKEFESHNFLLSDINPGSIMIVPRFRGAKNTFHAIMFLGKGRIKSGDFVQDATGQYMFTAHNRERIGNLIDSWDMSNVFVADVERILQIEYSKELKRLESMSTDNMIEYISDDVNIPRERLQELQRSTLLRLVQAKYFGDDIKKILSDMDTTPKIAMEQQLQLGRG